MNSTFAFHPKKVNKLILLFDVNNSTFDCHHKMVLLYVHDLIFV